MWQLLGAIKVKLGFQTRPWWTSGTTLASKACCWGIEKAEHETDRQLRRRLKARLRELRRARRRTW